jgi:hypothetical protein
MTRVYTAANPSEAELVRQLLEHEGIRAVVQGASLWGARGGLPFGTDTSPTVCVNDADSQRALQILADHKPAPEHCSNCGYNLFGLPEPRCPECGEPFDRPKGPPWQCEGCGEIIEGQFAACWKCGHERPEEPENMEE